MYVIVDAINVLQLLFHVIIANTTLSGGKVPCILPSQRMVESA